MVSSATSIVSAVAIVIKLKVLYMPHDNEGLCFPPPLGLKQVIQAGGCMTAWYATPTKSVATVMSHEPTTHLV
jgi:hypothetical protein